MQIASRSSASITFGLATRSKRHARPVPAAAAPPPPDSRPVAPPDVRLYQPALKAGAGLPQLAIAVADHERWHGDTRMVRPVAGAVVANRARYRVFGLRVIPPTEDGTEIPVRPGDRLEPSRRHDEDGNPTMGLHRGVAAHGFKDRPTLERAISSIGWQIGRQVTLIGGSSALRSDEEPDTHIILQPVVIRVWLRRFGGLGRIYDGLEHCDFD